MQSRANTFYQKRACWNRLGETYRRFQDLDTLQNAGKYKVATSPNRKQCNDVTVPPQATQEAAEKRLQEGNECVDWFLWRKSSATVP